MKFVSYNNEKEETIFLLGDIYPRYRNHKIVLLEEIGININRGTGNKEAQEVYPCRPTCGLDFYNQSKPFPKQLPPTFIFFLSIRAFVKSNITSLLDWVLFNLNRFSLLSCTLMLFFGYISNVLFCAYHTGKLTLGCERLVDESRDDMRVFKIVVVVGTIRIGWYNTCKLTAVLLMVGPVGNH